jgi:hypothetical protein
VRFRQPFLRIVLIFPCGVGCGDDPRQSLGLGLNQSFLQLVSITLKKSLK